MIELSLSPPAIPQGLENILPSAVPPEGAVQGQFAALLAINLTAQPAGFAQVAIAAKLGILPTGGKLGGKVGGKNLPDLPVTPEFPVLKGPAAPVIQSEETETLLNTEQMTTETIELPPPALLQQPAPVLQSIPVSPTAFLQPAPTLTPQIEAVTTPVPVATAAPVPIVTVPQVVDPAPSPTAPISVGIGGKAKTDTPPVHTPLGLQLGVAATVLKQTPAASIVLDLPVTAALGKKAFAPATAAVAASRVIASKLASTTSDTAQASQLTPSTTAPMENLAAVSAPSLVADPAPAVTGASPTASIQSPLASASSPQPAAAPHDFATLVDRLVEARDTAQMMQAPQSVQAAIAHAEFGQISLRFDASDAGLSVALASQDPDFARVVQAAAPANANPSFENTGSAPRQDSAQQGGSGTQSQAQSQTQQRPRNGQAQPQHRNSQTPAETSQGGIFA